jgi:hypothetical protein
VFPWLAKYAKVAVGQTRANVAHGPGWPSPPVLGPYFRSFSTDPSGGPSEVRHSFFYLSGFFRNRKFRNQLRSFLGLSGF